MENRRQIKQELRGNSSSVLDPEQIEKMTVMLKKIKDSLNGYFNNNGKISKLADNFVDILKRISIEKFNLENIRLEKHAHINEKFDDDMEQSKKEFRDRLRVVKETFESDNQKIEMAVIELKEANKRNWQKQIELQNLRKTNLLIENIIRDSKEDAENTMILITDYQYRIFEMNSRIKDMEYALKK